MSQDFWQRNLFWVCVSVVIVSIVIGLSADSMVSRIQQTNSYKACLASGTSQAECQKFLMELKYPNSDS